MTHVPFHELDQCECGDYRRDHENGTGRCRMPDGLTHGFKPCPAFRLAAWCLVTYEYVIKPVATPEAAALTEE